MVSIDLHGMNTYGSKGVRAGFRCFGFMVLFEATVCFSAVAAQPEAIEVLDRYEAGASRFKMYASTARSMTRWIDTASKVEPTWTRRDSEFRRDGNRIDEKITIWRGLKSESEEVAAETGLRRRVIIDGELWIQYKEGNKAAGITERVAIKRDMSCFDRHLSAGYEVYPLDGVLGSDLKLVSTILRDAEDLTLYEKRENIGGSPCYVLEGSTPSGDYKAWIDPSKGYNIMQAESEKHMDNLYFGERLGAPIPRPPSGLHFNGPIPATRKQYNFRMYDVRCENINGVWMPMAASYDTRLEQVDGRVITSTTHCKRLTIDLKPDFKALGAFVPDIPDGTSVSDLDSPRERHVWEGGSFRVATDNEAPEPAPRQAGDVSSAGSASKNSDVTKKSRKPIYDEKIDAEAQIIKALAHARKDNKRVLIVFGGNWCGWCYKLHDLFERNKEIRRVLFSEYEMILVDIKNNQDLGVKYKIENSFPYLTVLDAEGHIVKNQNTGDLEKGDQHDPDKVLAFLEKWKTQPPDAEEVLKEALRKAKKEDKKVFVRLSAPGCGWCRRLSDILHRKDVADILNRDYISLEIDIARMKNGEKLGYTLQNRELLGSVGPIPWFAILDTEGKKLITSDNPDGNINIGCPATTEGINYFKEMIGKTAGRITREQIETLGKVLQEEEAQRLKAERESTTQPG